MKLPKQFHTANFRFIKIISGTKKAQEADFNITNNYKYHDPEFKEYLQKASAYGVLCGFGNLVIIDCDRPEMETLVRTLLPPTFEVWTPGHKLTHFYYIVPDMTQKVILEDKDGTHYGECQFWNFYALGPGSSHPESNKVYTITNDVKITTITKAQLKQALGAYWKEFKTSPNISVTGANHDIMKVIEKAARDSPAIYKKNLLRLDENKGEFVGAHPVHGSENGENFRVNPDKNLWHCFRHNTGGDTLTFIAMVEGLISCENCTQDALKGDIFNQVIQLARDKYGLNVRPYIHDKATKNVFEFAEYLQKKYNIFSLGQPGGNRPTILLYKDGYYKLEDGEIAREIAQALDVEWSVRFYENVKTTVSALTKASYDILETDRPLINVNNGVFNIKTNKLLPHDSKYKFLYKLPFNYNYKARCPNIMKFFESTLSKEAILLSQEIFGYCLYQGYPLAAIFFLHGSGANGKGVWLQLLQTLLGIENTSEESIDRLANNQFSAANLFGKLANLSSESDTPKLTKSSILKALSSGDLVPGEMKGKDVFYFKNNAKMIFAVNSMPECDDKSFAWYRRQYEIRFLKTFKPQSTGITKAVLHLGDLLTNDKTEMEGLMVWAIQGLQRLLKNEKFTYSHDQEERHEKSVNQLEYFCSEYLESSYQIPESHQLSTQEIYDRYCDWANQEGLPQKSKTLLGRYLHSKDLGGQPLNKRVGKTSQTFWKNLKWRNQDDTETS